MSWIDFAFGFVSGIVVVLTVGVFAAYRMMRPFIAAAREKAKTVKDAGVFG